MAIVPEKMGEDQKWAGGIFFQFLYFWTTILSACVIKKTIKVLESSIIWKIYDIMTNGNKT